MPLPRPTVNELVATLQRTTAPTLLVEGTDDADVYRIVERRLSLAPGTVLSCGGRDTLLRVFLRRAEFASSCCAFLADRDLWLFAAPPIEYERVLLTRGYSIENDVLDTQAVEALLDGSEAVAFSKLLDLLSAWFAFEVQQWRQGKDPLLALHIQQIIDLQTTTFSAAWKACRSFTPPDSTLTLDVRANYRLKIRGKQLLQALAHILSAPSRRSKYSRTNIPEIAACSPNHSSLEALGRSIQRAFDATRPAQSTEGLVVQERLATDTNTRDENAVRN